MNHQKLIPLEAMRGLAAIIVLIHHVLLGFAPYISGLLPQARNANSFVGEWYFFLFNGTSSVTFFFTLSGFVLCWSYFNSGDKSNLLKAFFKRWPRLAGLVLITTLSSHLIFKLGLYYYEPASLISKSTWLLNFGCPAPYCTNGWAIRFEPSFIDAFTQGLTTFFTGSFSYNTNLWTMKLEFIGSIAVFLIAAFISLILSFNYLITASIIFLIWALSVNPYLVPFIAGIFLSAILAKYKTRVGFYSALSLMIIGVYLLSYLIPEKDFAWVALIQYPSLIADNIRIIINTIASVLIIFSIMTNDFIFNKLNGKLFSFLGKLSFPLYLVHTLVICSISSFSFITMHQYGYTDELVLIITFLITLLSSIIISLPLIYIDSFWLKKINHISGKLFKITNH
jgi:peptidoglycan/LPS O-acetylase OafA/YrhL